MILALLMAAAAVAQQPGPVRLAEVQHAIEAGRLEQARLMIGSAVAAGVRGPAIDRLSADLAFAAGRYHEAVGRYDALIAGGATETLLSERAGLAALKSGDRARARDRIARATAAADATWQAWNARAVLADLDGDFAAADEAYAAARGLAPSEAEVINNLGWSQLLRGDWANALTTLEQAAALDPSSTRIANNLELARAALADDLPRRRAGESDEDWAARLNDAGVVARLQGNKSKAIAAFTRAIEVRSSWFARAANNLEQAQAQQ